MAVWASYERGLACGGQPALVVVRLRVLRWRRTLSARATLDASSRTSTLAGAARARRRSTTTHLLRAKPPRLSPLLGRSVQLQREEAAQRRRDEKPWLR